MGFAKVENLDFWRKDSQIPSYVGELLNQMPHCQGPEKLSNSPRLWHASCVTICTISNKLLNL